MSSFKLTTNITGWLVFFMASIVYYLTAEPTGSLWDCGEFILGAYKMEVVHPPGAPLFMIIGRMFIWVAEILTDTKAQPENIAFAVNLMSGISTAFGAMFLAWITMIMGKLALAGREGQTNAGQNLALAGAGIVAGLAMTFSTSVWFSAVEGEVYAMSTFFTCLTMWTMIKWYHLPDEPTHDRWLVLTVYTAALSIGVHLLSLLTFPALALFYYFKKYRNRHTVLGMLAAAGVGTLFIVIIQKFIITGIAELWSKMELVMVNDFGLPFNSGLLPTLIIVTALFVFGLRYAHRKGSQVMQLMVVSALMSVVGFSTIGVIIIRANVDPPINMNRPSDPIRLLSYVNREQYGERPLLYGQHFDAQPSGNKIEERYGQVTVNGQDRYEITDEKISYEFNKADKQFFPRMSDDTQGRPEKYRAWIEKPVGVPTFADNIEFLFRYQLGWMYWRYFAWNFIGKQNGEQGFYSWDKKTGHWESGIKFIDEARLYKMDKMPPTMANDKSRNHYYFLPLILGILGLIFHFRQRSEDFIALLALFVITGIGIIIYSNQPPNEPRERDYVLVGSFFTFCIWIGMGVLFLYKLLSDKIGGIGAAALGTLLALSAPAIMAAENWDDHSRAGHYGARDYAANFLNSCAPNAIIFTYGDNDTYPLWYAQEVEGIRRDLRVVNLSLIQVDWYINLLRRKVNESDPIKLTVPAEAYRGKKRNAVYYLSTQDQGEMAATAALEAVARDRKSNNSRIDAVLPAANLYMPMDPSKNAEFFGLNPNDSITLLDRIPMKAPLHQTGQENVSYITKDELAIMDLIASNINDRPIYFAVTCRPEKMMGLQDYMQLEGLALRIVPVKSRSEQGMFVYGYGRVDRDKVYDNIMNTFKWGNFDQHETYIDRSYAPSIQSIRVVLLRTARLMNLAGEKDKAIALIEKYLSVFPHYNFPYDWNTMQMLNALIDAGAYDKAKPHMDILAKETAGNLAFYTSNPSLIVENGDFEQDYQLAMNVKDMLIRAAESQKDDAYKTELENLFAPYK
ncbi:MAG: hypothetical protein RI973_2275 [Bacteroidota bacterium]